MTPGALALSFCIQHHPARADLLADLEERVGPCEVVTDPDPDGKPNPLRTFLECLKRTPLDATHRIVLQDDCQPCRGFRAMAEAAIAERPGAFICFFVPDISGGGGNRVLRASIAGESWAQLGLGGWVPVVATVWPEEILEDFLYCIDQGLLGALTRSDDDVVTRFCRRRKVHVWATVPSLVEHPDDVESLIGRRAAAGKNRARVAALVHDLD